MKILIVHQHFKTPKTGGAIRSYYLAKALTDAGHEVAVITATNQPRSTFEIIDGIRVTSLPIAYDNRFKFYPRIFAFARFAFRAIIAARKLRHYDCCYAISVPLTTGLVARWLKLRYGMPYAFEVGDLWPEAPVQMGFIKNWLLKKILFAVERDIYQRARFIVALSPAIKKYIEQKVPRRQIVVVPNMADIDFYVPATERISGEWNTAGKFVIAYLGALGIANGLDYLLDCARASQKAGLPIQFLIAGDGAMHSHIERVKAHLKLDNLTLVEHVDRDGMKRLMAATDATFICYKPVPVLETGSPNKFFDGLAAGKLIVVNFKGWIKALVDTHQCGVYVNPYDSGDFVKKISPLLENPEVITGMQQRARMLAEQQFSRKQLSREFTALFTSKNWSAH